MTTVTQTAERLNLGSGEDYRSDWFNVDYNGRYGPDLVYDLNEPWPSSWTDSFDHVLASHVFEHLDDLHHAFSEAGRCLRPGGTLYVLVPFGQNGVTDRTHTYTHWTWDSCLQFAQNWREYSDDYQFDPAVPFDLESRAVTDLTGHGPGRFIKPLIVWWWERREKGVWLSSTPWISGEFTFRYRRIKP